MKVKQNNNPEDSKIKKTSKMKITKNHKKKHGIIFENDNNFVYKSIYNNGSRLRSYIYPSIEYTFSNKMVNDDNQYFWGDWPIEGMDLSNDALFERVMNGLIPMCKIVERTKEKIDSYLQKLDLNKFSVAYSTRFMNSSKEPYYDLFIAHKGTLGELFYLDSLEDDYGRCGIMINVEFYMDKTIEEITLNWMNNDINTSCDIWLTGLLNGCPVENIISIYHQFYREKYPFGLNER